MNFINNIIKETLIICHDSIKKQIISLNTIKNIKIMNFDEFIKKFYFDYDENAIIYIMNKLNIKYDVAQVYLKNIYYIKNKEYLNEKLDLLKELKEDLINRNLLYFNDLFLNYLKSVDIIFYDIDLEPMHIKDLKEYNYKIINPSELNYNHNVIEFNKIEEEIAYVAHQISDLIYNKIDINNIKLTNIESEYYNSIERIFSLYNLKVAIPYKTSLSSYKYVKEFITNYQNSSLEEAITHLDNKHPLYEPLINTINKYIKYDNKKLIIDKLSSTYITNKKYKNSIEIIDYLTYEPNDKEYIFMLSFNDQIIPKSIKDIDYITDNIKEYVDLETTREKNQKLRNKIVKKIKSIKNLTITYKLQDYKKSFYPSTLCSFFTVIKADTNHLVSYSEKYNKLKLAICMDNYIKYGYKDKEYEKLNLNFNINYNSYDNQYHLINRTMDKLTLSYSKMNIYNKCAFRYYLTDILKLDFFEENFSTIIGNMVHYVMEQSLSNKDNDIEKYFTEFLTNKEFSNKELFFLEKYKIAVTNLLNQVILEKEYSSFDNAFYEKNIIIEYNNNITFKGIIDKILYTETQNKTILSLIDYKTGNDDISLKYLKYGIDIQLPIYLYLSNYLNLRNIVYSGFYLQKLNITKNDYRLDGYSNSDPDILSYMDKDYTNSKIIKGMKVNKDGSFAKNTKVLSNEQITKIIDITKELIDTTINNIKNNEFQINPKKDDDKIIGCEFCSFKDICFVKNKDYLKITSTSLEEIL